MSPRARVTGFGPFGAVASNPSDVVARALADGLRARGWDARSETLSVTFEVARTTPLRLLAESASATLLLHVGVAERRSVISLERTAMNVAGARPDVAHVVSAALLDAKGPPSRVTSIDLGAVLQSIVAPFDVEISDDAGDYVCNALYYASLAAAAARDDVRSLFVHVPPMTDDDARAVGRALAEARLA